MILDEIVANKRAEVARRKQQTPLAQIRAAAEAAPPPRDFAAALRGDEVALIAEIKRASPSRGSIRAEDDPPARARLYASAGASAISILTDAKYFSGSLDDLSSTRANVALAILRKDFIIDEYQIYESRAARADAILLIVRLLSNAQLENYIALTHSLMFNALVEVHDARDLDRAISSGARIVGINNRNLADMSIDLATPERLAPRVPPGHIVVSESGVSERSHVERAGDAGAHAVLVGEALMRANDVAQKVRELTGVRRELK